MYNIRSKSIATIAVTMYSIQTCTKSNMSPNLMMTLKLMKHLMARQNRRATVCGFQIRTPIQKMRSLSQQRLYLSLLTLLNGQTPQILSHLIAASKHRWQLPKMPMLLINTMNPGVQVMNRWKLRQGKSSALVAISLMSLYL